MQSQKTLSPLRTLMVLLARQKIRLCLAITLAIAGTLLELCPYYLLYLAAQSVFMQNFTGSSLLSLAGLLAIALLTKYVFMGGAYYFSHIAAFQILYDLRLKIAQALSRLSLSSIQKYSSGGLRKIILNDVGQLENFFAHHCIELTCAILSPVVAGGFLFWLDWKMALAALVSVPLAVITQALCRRNMPERAQAYNQTSEELNGIIVEYVRNIPVMKAFKQTSSSFSVLRQHLQAYSALVSDIIKITVPSWSLFTIILSANIFILLPFGLWRIENAQLDIPTFVLILMLGSGLLKPLLRVSHFSSLFIEILTSAKRIEPFINASPKIQTAQINELHHYEIEIKHLNCLQDQNLILEDLCLALPEGSFNALIGVSGSGKSTLVQILAGLLSPNSGEIRIGGVDLQTVQEATRAKTIAVVTQDTFLFQGTFADNLRLGNPLATDEEILDALLVAQALDFVMQLPKGLYTYIHERGIQLSTGERQRLAIAQALLVNPKVLILDEATAFSDVLREKNFYESLRAKYPTTTILSITHRLETVQTADQILLLNSKHIEAAGTHEHLIENSATYQKLWDSQFNMDTWHICSQRQTSC